MLVVTLASCKSNEDTKKPTEVIQISTEKEDTEPTTESEEKQESEQKESAEKAETDLADTDKPDTHTVTEQKPSGSTGSQGKTEPVPEKKPNDTYKETYEFYENMNRSDPVQGERVWKFHSTDPNYAAPHDPSQLAECCITIDETDHVTMFWNYYYKAADHPEFSVGGNESVKFDGVDYYWFLCYRYEGTCFVEQNGAISIEMKCSNDWGEWINDGIYLQRDGTDKLIVTGHDGNGFCLYKGDEFTRL